MPSILMPALSPTMEEGKLAKWLVKVGDKVRSGDVIAEIETDKATMEVEAVDEGVVDALLVPEGTEAVKVNTVIAQLREEGASAAPAKPKPAAAPPAPAKAPAAPVAAAKPAAPAVPLPRVETAARLHVSPLARRLAAEGGIDLSRVGGSGPHGRIVKADIEAALKGGGAKAAPAPARPQPVATPGPAPVAPVAAVPQAVGPDARLFFAKDSYVEVPHDSMRKTIARRLLESKLTIPHFYLTADCDIGALLRVREEINATAPKDKDGKPAFKLSVNDFVIKAMALALQKVPHANVTWTDAAMLRHKHSDIGVAVAIEGGLVTPVIRHAEGKSLSAISNEMKDYAARAKAKKLKPQEFQGGATAISNLGMYGVKDFAAVINPPHATILAVGAGEERAVVRDGQIVAASIMTVTLSCDHRAVDGALGAQLLSAFREAVEKPLSLMA